MSVAFHRACTALRGALRRLHVFEAEQIDLATGARLPDSAMPPEWLATLDELRARVSYCAAIVAGESPDEATLYSDEPERPSNPYNIQRARFAAALRF